MVKLKKNARVPPAAQDALKIRYDILDPVNLSDERLSLSFGTTANWDKLFIEYMVRVNAKDMPVLFVFENEQVIESGWKLKREQPKK